MEYKKKPEICKICNEPAIGFYFGVFTCGGCKSFFGRTLYNRAYIPECRNGGNCKINKENRTSCKSCRLQKCQAVGMNKRASRFGRPPHCTSFKKLYNIDQQKRQRDKNTTQR
ncbi:hypothetical protein DMN91_011959 [Ooceraea biroi]|uniref:Nuclear receptor domain-containing protein n=2 Tax=Ooceraea biroi TaxID=2015173 RepID=A0A3L8D7D0_OOCBI|nr:hypothetical protein DMN91_011959 [Ooceraea biroi]